MAISTGEIEELVRLASLSPSAYNLQNWRFIAVQSPGQKQALKAAAHGQAQVETAAVTFVVCGDTGAYQQLDQTLALSVNQQVMPAKVANAWVNAANEQHGKDPTARREEAIRSASLAAMTLMYAAQGLGYASGAMGGFDEQAVRQLLNLPADWQPVLLVTVGMAAEGNWPQKIRRPVDAILRVV